MKLNRYVYTGERWGYMCGSTVTRQACGEQKWSVLTRSLDFLLIVQREREKEREREQSMLVIMSMQSVESFACCSYQAALQGTAGHCFLLLKWALGNLVRWLMWPATAVGTVPVDIPDCLLWPCRQVLGPGDEPIVKSGQTKTQLARPLATGLHVHIHTCAHSLHAQHTYKHAQSGTWIPLGQGES